MKVNALHDDKKKPRFVETVQTTRHEQLFGRGSPKDQNCREAYLCDRNPQVATEVGDRSVPAALYRALVGSEK